VCFERVFLQQRPDAQDAVLGDPFAVTDVILAALKGVS
jgi:hypothetical protein